MAYLASEARMSHGGFTSDMTLDVHSETGETGFSAPATHDVICDRKFPISITVALFVRCSQ
jgi:hypothetical protein